MDSITLSAARLQFASMLRELLPWTTVAAVVWTTLVAVQEPGFAQRFGVPFHGPSFRFGAMLLGALLGVIAAESGATSWRSIRDRSRRPTRAVLGSWLGGVGFAAVAALVFVGCAAAATSTLGRQMTSFHELAREGAVMLLTAANTLALAPSVASCGRGLAFRVVVWTLLAATSSGAFGFSVPIPIPVLWSTPSFLQWEPLVPILTALLASVCVAIVAGRRKITPTPDSR